jgi:YidC/Oxa1 family membrane protein insertase
LLNFLYYGVSWVLLRWHQLFTAMGIQQDSGVNWTLSIVFLVITARLVLFRFFVKQVHYQRKMQELQPRMKLIKEKYKDDKQAQQREMMKLQQDEGFSPLAGCLPMFLQIPVFLGLLHVLRHLSAAATSTYQTTYPARLHLYGFSVAQTLSAAKANIFHAPLAGKLLDSASTIAVLGGHKAITRLVIVVLILVSAVATLATQLMLKRNATTTPEGNAATIQRLMLYFVPLSVLGSGLFFPLGVLLYWFTSNLWTLGQQAYIIRFHPPAPAGANTQSVDATKAFTAPKPGQKPDYNRGRSPSSEPMVSMEKSTDSDVAVTPTNRAPRPGSRPARPANNRPAGKRPSQAKKRR